MSRAILVSLDGYGVPQERPVHDWMVLQNNLVGNVLVLFLLDTRNGPMEIELQRDEIIRLTPEDEGNGPELPYSKARPPLGHTVLWDRFEAAEYHMTGS